MVAVSTDRDPVSLFLTYANNIASTWSGKVLRYVTLNCSLPAPVEEAAGGLIIMNKLLAGVNTLLLEKVTLARMSDLFTFNVPD